MESIINFFVSIFWIVLIVAVVFLYILYKSYNKLRELREEVREKKSNVGGAVKKMVDVINKASEVVKGYKGFEQVTHLKVSQDNTATDLMSTVQQSSTMMATLQGAAQRFPDLKSSGLYQDLMEDIRKCHSDIEEKGQEFNKAVKIYNTYVLGFPAVFFARFVGFGREEYLNFDTQGMEEHVGMVSRFDSEDDDRVEQLLQNAGSRILGTTKGFALHASQAGRQLAAKIKEHSRAQYFYASPGGVPKGPVSLEVIRTKLEQGEIGEDVLLAESGTEDWKPLTEIQFEATNRIPREAPKPPSPPEPPQDLTI